MENQYTYYKPEPDDMNGMNEETPKPKKNRKAVSYTHLDVYKRQAWTCKISQSTEREYSYRRRLWRQRFHPGKSCPD